MTKKEAEIARRLEDALRLVAEVVLETGLVVVVAVEASDGFWMRSAIKSGIAEGGPPGKVLTRELRAAIHSYLSRCPNALKTGPRDERPS